MGRTGSQKTFFLLEFLDVASDILTLFFCESEGDLNLEDGEWVAAALAISVGLSALLFVVEVAVAKCRPADFKKAFFGIMSLHIMGEDVFQTLMYVFLVATQAQAGLSVSDALCVAVGQASVFLI